MPAGSPPVPTPFAPPSAPVQPLDQRMPLGNRQRLDQVGPGPTRCWGRRRALQGQRRRIGRGRRWSAAPASATRRDGAGGGGGPQVGRRRRGQGAPMALRRAEREHGVMAQAPTDATPRRSAGISSTDHLSTAERIARGKAARATAPRQDHEVWEPSTLRPDPVALLQGQAQSRVPELVPIRYGRMLVSPFTFFRGAALIMASDLATTPRSGLSVQACGDAHLSNFGVFASAERNLVFDVNDFDETLPGPWEWDVKRLAASLAIAGRERGFSRKERADGRIGDGRGLPDRDDQVGGHAGFGRVVLPDGHREGNQRPRAGSRSHGEAGYWQVRARVEGPRRKSGGQGQDPRQHAGTGEAHRGRRRSDPVRERSTPDRPHRGAGVRSPRAPG